MKRYNLIRRSSGKTALPSFNQSLQFKNTSFAFGETQVIKNVSFSIPKNATVALVGESGSGKTTLTDLMSLLLKPQGGQILFDGIPADALDLASWRKKIGFVTQDTVIFDDTIANNITLWEGNYDEDTEVQTRVAHTRPNRLTVIILLPNCPRAIKRRLGSGG